MPFYRWRYSALIWINVVILRRARLGQYCMEWVTVAGSCRVYIILVFNQQPRLSQPGHPSVVDKMSTSKSWGVNRHTTQCSVCVFVRCRGSVNTYIWQVSAARSIGPFGSGKNITTLFYTIFKFNWFICSAVCFLIGEYRPNSLYCCGCGQLIVTVRRDFYYDDNADGVM